MFRKASDFYVGRSEFRINSKFYNTLVVPESAVLPLADRWDQGPLSVSPSSFGSLFFLSPTRFPGFLHRRCLARRASRPYCGSARRASCRCSVHSPRGPVHCRHCSRIRLRTPVIERRAVLVDFAHRTPISSYKMTEVLLSCSSHLASLLLLLPPPSFLFVGARDEALMAEVTPDWCMILVCRGLATFLGLSVLLCVMILNDRRDAAARVLVLHGGGDHED